MMLLGSGGPEPKIFVGCSWDFTGSLVDSCTYDLANSFLICVALKYIHNMFLWLWLFAFHTTTVLQLAETTPTQFLNSHPHVSVFFKTHISTCQMTLLSWIHRPSTFTLPGLSSRLSSCAVVASLGDRLGIEGKGGASSDEDLAWNWEMLQ